MTYKIEISVQAETDLRDIYLYIAYGLESPENALGQLERLENSISTLEQLPERFRKYQNEPWYSRGLRIMPVDKYLVFYIPEKKNTTVTIIRIMFKSRDYNTQLER